MIVVVTEKAEQDLERIGDYIATFNPRRAASLVEELYGRCKTLAQMPHRFARSAADPDGEIRHFSQGNYIVYYRVDSESVIILRILHAAQDVEALLFPDQPP